MPPQSKTTMSIRSVNGLASIIDIQGELTAFTEDLLFRTYQQASSPGVRVIILNFSELEYMNSSGIGLIVTLLIKINKQKQLLFAYGLNQHYQNIFRLTRLSDSIKIYPNEVESIKALRPIAMQQQARSDKRK